MKKLRNDGWVVSRSAMSHGPVDIFAAKDGVVRLIQVKSGSSKMKKGEVETLKSWGDHFDATAEIWYYKKKGKLQKHVVRDQKVVVEEITISSSSRRGLP